MADADRRVVNEWTLVAVLHHRPGRPTGVEVLDHGDRLSIEAWSRAEGWCEHCRTRRARCVPYLLRDDRGHLAQVGANCLAEFTGHPRAHDLIARRSTRHTTRRSHSMRHRGVSIEAVEYIDARSFLAHAAQAVFDSGFIPAHTGRRWPPPTWTHAATALDLGRPLSRRAVRRANEVLQWVRDELGSKDDPEDFERRLVELLSQERLTRRELPTAAAAVYSYHQHLHRVIAARAAAGSSDPTDRR